MRRWAIAAASRLLGVSSFRRMCETWTLAVLMLMTSASAISRLVWPRATRRQYLRLARRQPEDCSQVVLGASGARSGGSDRAGRAGEQVELAQQRLRADASGDGVRLPERYARLGAGRAGGDECLGLAPAAVGRERRPLEQLPGGAASDHDSGWATPWARSYSASASASQPAAFGVTADASWALSRATASSFRALASHARAASVSRRARARAASSACARSPLAQNQMCS